MTTIPSRRIGASGAAAGQPTTDRNASLTPRELYGTAGREGYLDEMRRQWPRVAARYAESEAQASACAIEAVPYDDETPEEVQFNEALHALITGRTGVLTGDRVRYGLPLLLARMHETPWYGFTLLDPYWDPDSIQGGDPLTTGKIVLRPLLRSAVQRFIPDPSTGAWLRVEYMQTLPAAYAVLEYADLIHVTHNGAPGEAFGRPELRPLCGPFAAWREGWRSEGGVLRAGRGRLIVVEPERADDVARAAIDSILEDFDGDRAGSMRVPHGSDAQVAYPSGSPPDFAAFRADADRYVDELFSARTSSLGILGAGSRATAEVLSADDDATRRSAWALVVDAAYQAIGSWVARQVGFTGRVRVVAPIAPPRSEQPADRLALYTGIEALRAQGAPQEVIRSAATDVGLDPDVIAPITADAGAESKILPVGSLQSALAIAQALSGAPGTVPVAPGAALELLKAAGVPADSAERIVAASAGQTAPAALPEAKPSASPGGVIAELADGYRPTETMAKEAQRGIDWRKEYGRGGTEIGVARARDIANRRNLSADTVRRMRSYFARHEVDKKGNGWSPGEDGYPSAGRIAWALWGGDAGRAWAESRAELHDHACGADCAHLSEPVIWPGRDGVPYPHSRQPAVLIVDGANVSPELSMAFAELDDVRAVADAGLQVAIGPIAAEHRAAVWAALGTGYSERELTAIYDTFRARYEAAILAYQSQLRAASAAQASAEAGASVVPTSRDGLDTGALAQWATREAERVRVGARAAADTITSRVQGEVVDAFAAGASPATFTSRQTPKGLAGEAAGSAARIESVATVQAAADGAVGDGLVVIAALRTSQRDPEVCEWCASQDGLSWTFPEDEARFLEYMDAHSLPDQSCAGRSRCRCRITLVWGRG